MTLYYVLLEAFLKMLNMIGVLKMLNHLLVFSETDVRLASLAKVFYILELTDKCI